MNKILLAAVLACLAWSISGCGGSGSGNPGGGGGGGSIAISVTPRNVALTYTQTQTFQAIVTGTTNTAVSWTVDGVAGGNSSVGTITSGGLYTPPAQVGQHTVTATSAADPSKTASGTAYISNYAGAFSYHNDNARTGQNLAETVLTTLNVNSGTFGKLYSYSVDGYVYAQPLYVANLNMGGALGTHNVVYVATEHDSVYAFDADNRSASPLWHASFLGAGVTTVPSSDVGTNDIVPEIGITGTPVIDPGSNTLYVIAKTKETGGGTTSYVQRLHALDITSGGERPGSPVVITASVPGTGDGSDGVNVPFDPLRENQRSALLLANGVVYVVWASHGDNGPYHGWVIGYNASTLARLYVYNDTANGGLGGIWMSGGGPAADASNNLYVMTGNGTFDANLAGADYGDTFLKLSSALSVGDWFTPYNQASLEAADQDLGSGAPLLVSNASWTVPNLVISAGKQGRIYLVNRNAMGGFNATGDSQIVQYVDGQISGLFSTPSYWNGNVYFLAAGDSLKSFQLSSAGLLSTAPGTQSSANFGFPGATVSISANGSSAGIVWALKNDQYGSSGPSVLYAFDATNVASQLYASSQNSADQAGPAVKFTVPTVANGKVFVGTQNQLDVYGLRP